MAWTTPTNWTTGQIVTAAQLNQQVRDNLRYLKGLDGPVAINSRLNVLADGIAQLQLASNTHSNIGMYFGVQDGALRIDANRDPGSGNMDDPAKSHARFMVNGNGTSSYIAAFTAATANTFASEKMRIDGNGRLGVGTTNPLGLLHVHGGFGRLLTYEATGVDASARTLVPTGTFPNIIAGHSLVVASDGGKEVRQLNNVGGSPTFTLYNTGGSTLWANWSSGGITIQRTAGSATFSVYMLIYGC